MVYCINKFRHHITRYPIFIHINNFDTHYLMNNPTTNAHATIWLLLLQEFDITIINKLGKENVATDFLSRLTNVGHPKPVEDSFREKNIYSHYLLIIIHTPTLLIIWLQENFQAISMPDNADVLLDKMLGTHG